MGIRMQKIVSALLVFSMFHFCAVLFLPAGTAVAASVSVPEETALGQNPDSSVVLDSDGMPVGASGTYYPAETNMILGRTPLLTPVECVKRYGVNFCACAKLDSGEEYCYYRRPAAGYYEDLASCESVWGAGYCYCPEAGRCQLIDTSEVASELDCLGQIYIFSGEKFECRKAGVLSAGENCCKEPDAASESCSFENLSKKLGLDDLAMTALSLGSGLINLGNAVGLVQYSFTELAAQKISEVIVSTYLSTGTLTGLTSSLSSLFPGFTQEYLQNMAMEITTQAIQEGGMSAASQVAATNALATQLAPILSAAGWIYFAYQVYNMYTSLQQCSAGEMTLSCKIAKGVCHHVGNRCKVKVLGSCLQQMKVYCCFSTKLARIINEQGRPQIGRDWGSAKSPECRGFYVNEFAMLDLSRMDLSEYQDDLIREMSPNIADKIKKATQNLTQGIGASQ